MLISAQEHFFVYRVCGLFVFVWPRAVLTTPRTGVRSSRGDQIGGLDQQERHSWNEIRSIGNAPWALTIQGVV